MEIEDFLDFREPGYIQIKGSRMGIDQVLHEYLKDGSSADEIHFRYGTPLAGIYAAILYYLSDPEKVGKYLRDTWDLYDAWVDEYDKNPKLPTRELLDRFLAIRAEREAASVLQAKKEN